AGAPQTSVAAASGIPRSTLGRLVRRTRALGQIACVPRGTYARKTTMHPAFQECIRRLYVLPTRLSMTAIHEHTEMRQVAVRLAADMGKAVPLPSYDQVRRAVHRLTSDPALVAMRDGAKALPRMRESPHAFALAIPAPRSSPPSAHAKSWWIGSGLLRSRLRRTPPQRKGPLKRSFAG